MSIRTDSRSPALRWLVAIVALTIGTVAFAAWPDSYAGRISNLNALRQDMAYPGVPHNAKRTKRLYDSACAQKSSSACSYETWWNPETGGDLQKARSFYKSKCPSDPQSCVVVGWSYTLDANGQLNPTDAKKGYSYFQTACTKKLYAAGCTAMGEMHMYGVGVKKSYKTALARTNEGCKAKDPYGCYLAGTMYEKGWGTPVNLAKAISLYRKACRQDVPHACVQLAVLQEEGTGLPRDPEAAAKTFGAMCEGSGFTTACSHLGRMYEQGRAVPRQLAVAEQLYKKSCDLGDLVGCFGLAKMYEKGRSEGGGPAQAAEIYERACNVGNANACTRLGKLYLRGKGVGKDPSLGVGFISKACDGGESNACDVLGQLYESGNGVEQNLTRASQLYNGACEAGEGVGCYHLAKLHQVGKGVDADTAKAGVLFQQACDTGHGKSCSRLAENYILGEGVPKNMAKAAELLEKGCTGGDASSCAKLAGMLDKGKGVQKDPVRAFSFYVDACAYEHGHACYMIAKKYESGEGAEKNVQLAVQAYKDSCNYGHERACQEGGSIIFQARFQEIVDLAFHSKMCQIWSLDPEKPDSSRLLVDVRGDEFVMMDGPLKGETIKPKMTEMNVVKGKKYRGVTSWEAETSRGMRKFDHVDSWDSEEDPIDAFPSDKSRSKDRIPDTTTLIYSRAEEMVRRNEPAKKCKFPAKMPLLTTEHCSEIQALVGAQLSTTCKGE
jgi:hypothetical protein